MHLRLAELSSSTATQEQLKALMHEFDSALDSLTPENQSMSAELVNMVVYLAQVKRKKITYVFRQLEKVKVPYVVLHSARVNSFEEIPGKLKIVCKTAVLKEALHWLGQKIEVSPQLPLQQRRVS